MLYTKASWKVCGFELIRCHADPETPAKAKQKKEERTYNATKDHLFVSFFLLRLVQRHTSFEPVRKHKLCNLDQFVKVKPAYSTAECWDSDRLKV